MNKRHRSLLGRKDALLKQCDAITAAPEGEGAGDEQELSTEQRATLDAHLATIKTLNADIAREQALAAEALTAVPLEPVGHITGGVPVILKDPKFGWNSLGEQCRAIIHAGRNKHSSNIDERLQLVAAAPSTYGSEGVGADGGFLVAPEFSSSIFQHSLEADAILPMTDNQEIGSNSITYPKDETTPWGSDGVRVYWEGEASAATATKPILGTTTHRLHKLLGLVPLTDELMDDGPALGSFVNSALSRSIRWKMNNSFVNGTGAGQPLGILNAGALVSVPKITSTSPDQAADTFLVGNVASMFARMPAESMSRAVWMVNNDVIPQLITMVLNNQPIYMAPGALPNAPAGTLLGRPIMPSQHCQTLGDLGDVYFVDWGMYRTITKAGGIKTATSMHLYFDAEATAFRASFRVDGQPKISAAITPANGSNTLSPFIALAARA